MDEVDLKILRLLQTNAKITAKDLGDQISLSLTPIYERIKKLERQGFIKKYVAILDPEPLNMNVVVFLYISMQNHEKGARELMAQQLAFLPQIVQLHHTSGRYHFVAKVHVSHISLYWDFLSLKISAMDNIKDLIGHVVLEEIKHTTAVL